MPQKAKVSDFIEESKRIIEEDADLEDGSMSYRPPNKPPTITIKDHEPPLMKKSSSNSSDHFNQTIELRRFFYGQHGSFKKMSGSEQAPGILENSSYREESVKSTVSS
mmetsp:Transcript_35897/g.55114  ORF Transcript_35897/g.55114 Transcript_35897/m.55114 type:complete len:108 (-) Transcript_35897:1602-1925(-)